MALKTKTLIFIITQIYFALSQIEIDGSKLGRRFDGIGALSGGGATSRLLIDYPEPFRSDILDYLFLPNFGASLQILKVEIGGDDFTSNGVEPSHMRSPTEENYYRGYEWWLMKEAKRRNPDIIIYGLPWSFPGWIGEGNGGQPLNEKQAIYQSKWVKGAMLHHNISIDYLGIWNEKGWTANYTKILRKSLDQYGFHNVKIVLGDLCCGLDDWDYMADAIRSDNELAKAVSVMGTHYPVASMGSPNASMLGIPMWSSEDSSTYFDAVGAGCWARIVNWNYMNGNMTATIMWNLLTAYVEGDAWYGDSLFEASNPWSGSYDLRGPLWVTAHTTQFTNPGWIYLQNNTGSGWLPNGGSFVSLVSPDLSNFTIIIETMTTNHSQCIRCNPSWNWTVSDHQNLIFNLKGGLENINELYVRRTSLFSDPPIYFEKSNVIQVENGVFKIVVGADEVWTLSTMNTGNKGHRYSPPAPKPFPIPYKDNFEGYKPPEMARYFSDMSGSFAAHKTSNGTVLRQEVRQLPVPWCTATDFNNTANYTLTITGDWNMTDIEVSVDVYIEENDQAFGTPGKAILGARVGLNSDSYCYGWYEQGVYLMIDTSDQWTAILGNAQFFGTINVNLKQWYNLKLKVQGDYITGYVDNVEVFTAKDSQFPYGWVGIGSGWHYTYYDNFQLNSIKN